MSRLNVPEENQNEEQRSAFAERAIQAHWDRALDKIVNPRRRRKLHPEAVQDLLIEKHNRRKVVHPQYGWNLFFLDAAGNRTAVDIMTVPNADGTRRHACYSDVVSVRDDLMKRFGYQLCWLRMRTAEDVRKVG